MASVTENSAPANVTSLDGVRAEIDAIDDAIIDLLARRQGLVRRAADFKRDADEVRGEDRRRAVMQRLERRAAALGLDGDVVTAVWTAMIDAFVALELRAHADRRAGDDQA
jgi:isochorismate pyruvate lyase